MLKAEPPLSASSCQIVRSELVGGDRPFELGEALLGPAPEDLEKEVVHRAEVVVDELRLEAGLGRDPPRRDGGVALFEQQLLGRVEQPGTGVGVLGADAPGRGGGGHADTLPRRRPGC